MKSLHDARGELRAARKRYWRATTTNVDACYTAWESKIATLEQAEAVANARQRERARRSRERAAAQHTEAVLAWEVAREARRTRDQSLV